MMPPGLAAFMGELVWIGMPDMVAELRSAGGGRMSLNLDGGRGIKCCLYGRC